MPAENCLGGDMSGHDEEQRSIKAPRRKIHRANYSMLSGPGFRHPITKAVSEKQWVEVNVLLDRRVSNSDVAAKMDLDVAIVDMIANPRRCIEKYSGDKDAIKKCLEEKS